MLDIPGNPSLVTVREVPYPACSEGGALRFRLVLFQRLNHTIITDLPERSHQRLLQYTLEPRLYPFKSCGESSPAPARTLLQADATTCGYSPLAYVPIAEQNVDNGV